MAHPRRSLVCLRIMAKQTEAFSRVVIDAQLSDAKWNLTDGRSVRYEYALPNGRQADYVLNDRHGRALAVVEAKRMAIDPLDAQKQAKGYATHSKFRWCSSPTAGKSGPGTMSAKPIPALSRPSSSRPTLNAALPPVPSAVT